MSELLSVKGDDFTGVALQEGTKIVTSLKGNADYAAIDAVEKLLEKTHDEALRTTASEVVIDLRQLEFMNSSCFKVFVSWLGSVQDLDASKQYRIHLLSNPNLHWQRRSLAALSCFAVDLVTITT